MKTYVIDFETTFSKDHTLTKQSIEEYVRHPKFEVIGCAVLDEKGVGGFFDPKDFMWWQTT